MKSNIVRPIITEKSLSQASRGWFTFVALTHSTKQNLLSEIHTFFKVDPVEIRTTIMHGKMRRVGKKMSHRKLSDWKKVMVHLKNGQSIEAFNVAPEKTDAKK
jgi:large subunit ribosomal protein L23